MFAPGMSKRRDFPITKNFRLSEFEVSASHPELVESIPDALMPRVIELAVTMLQPLRTRLGPMRVTSGYRAPALNNVVRGSKHSQHLRAEAADIDFVDNQRAFDTMRGRWNEFRCGQVIHYPEKGFVHIALPSKRYPIPIFFEVRDGAMKRVYSTK
jgi:uncharacterized protein YcbK (DUF882 family)